MADGSVKAIIGSTNNGGDEFASGAGQRVVFSGCGRGVQVHACAQCWNMIAMKLYDSGHLSRSTDGCLVLFGEHTFGVIFRNGFYPSHDAA